MTEAGPPGPEVAFGLGSNIGDKAKHIRDAARRLVDDGLVEALAVSSLYRTPPWGPVEQDWFVNACAVGRTALSPHDLLARIKSLETALGRTATVRWGPRVIDIDILYYGDLALDTPGLTLPHREMLQRPFVLVPLAELRPERRIGGLAVRESLLRLAPHAVEWVAAPPSA